MEVIHRLRALGHPATLFAEVRCLFCALSSAATCSTAVQVLQCPWLWWGGELCDQNVFAVCVRTSDRHIELQVMRAHHLIVCLVETTHWIRGHPIFCCSFLLPLQDHVARLKRFLKAEKEVAVEDETMGGQQENVMLGLHKQVCAM